MRVTIVPIDGFISKDGDGILGLEFSIDPAIHAIQWYETFGEIEYKQYFNGSLITRDPNQIITDFSPYEHLLDVWLAAKEERDIRYAEEAKKVYVG